MTERERLAAAIDIASSIALTAPNAVGVKSLARPGAALRVGPDVRRAQVRRADASVVRPLLVVRARWRLHLRGEAEPGSTGILFAVHDTTNANASPAPSDLRPTRTSSLVRLHVDARKMLVAALMRELSRRVHVLGDRALLERHRNEIDGLRATAHVLSM